MAKSSIVMLAFMMLLVFSVVDTKSLEYRSLQGIQSGKLVFYKFFTPKKLASAATFIHPDHSITPRLLTFLSAPSGKYRLLVVPLILPGVMNTTAKLVVKMAVALETTLGGRVDTDPSFVISDGNLFNGFMISDKANYRSRAPCLGIDGFSGITMSRYIDAYLPKPSESQYYPGRYEIQLSLFDRWGTCFVPLDGGFSREMVYQFKLNPHSGLFLEVYGEDAQEKEGIKYIELSILQEN